VLFDSCAITPKFGAKGGCLFNRGLKFGQS